MVERTGGWSDNIIKGRIAETIVEEMLKKAGYKVYRLGYESILQNLTQADIKLKESDTVNKIKAIPDLLIVDKKGDVTLIEVKFRTEAKKILTEEKKLKILAKHWSEAYVLLVSLDEGIFNVISLSKEWKDYLPLYPTAPFNLNEEILDKSKKLVKRYLDKNGRN